MDIHFHHTDRALDHLWDLKELHQAANLVNENKELLNDVADLILTSTNINRYKTRKAGMLAYIDNPKLKEVMNLFERAMEKLKDNGSSQDNNLKQLRGAFLEILIYKIISPRFEKKNHNCRVKIDSETIFYHDKRTIDIACYNSQENKGEFFECKVNPYWFNEKEFGYLLTLYNKLDEKVDKLIVAGVSFDYASYVKIRFAEKNIRDIYPFGREHIEKLIDNKIWSYIA